MKENKKSISLIIPLILGLSIIYYQYSTLTSSEINKIKDCFEKANYNYIYLSLFVALFGYWSRAYRWKYALNHLGFKTKFHNDFFTVCVSYLVNLTIPRSGEISRAALLKNTKTFHLTKVLELLWLERIVDLLVFLLFVILAFFFNLINYMIFLQVKFHLKNIDTWTNLCYARGDFYSYLDLC